MTKRLKVILLIMLAAFAATCTIAGCSIGKPTLAELTADYKGGVVTYYANGGCFDETAAVYVRELYYKNETSNFYNITSDTTDMKITCSGYDFAGWYKAETYSADDEAVTKGLAEEGDIKFVYVGTNSSFAYTGVDSVASLTPVYYVRDEDGEIKTDSSEKRPLFHAEDSDTEINEKYVIALTSDEIVDEDDIVSNGDKLTVCACWIKSLQIVYKFAFEDTTKEFEAKDGSTYKHGDTLKSVAFGSKDTTSPSQLAPVEFSDMTFVKTYADEACTTVANSVNRNDDGADVVVWCKYIEGDWTIIENEPSAIRNMFRNLDIATNKYYLLNDVDCSSVTMTAVDVNYPVKATIQGNGHTLSNLTYEESPTYGVGALFGTIGSGACIENLTISNVTITLNFRQSVDCSAVCKDISDEATVNNVVIDNISMTVSYPESITPAVTETKWLFGSSGGDATFMAAHTGITVTNYTFNITTK